MSHGNRRHAATVLTGARVGVLAGVLAAATARADFQFTSFPSGAGVNLYGAAGASGGALRITPSQFNVAGAAYHGVRQGVTGGFSTTFTFRLTDPVNGSADGFAFVIHNSQVNLGGTGCRLGYHGIPNSLAVEFDTQYNGTCEAGSVGDPNGNHVSVHTVGVFPNSALESASVGRTSAVPLLEDGNTHTVTIEYDLYMLRVFVDNPGGPPVLEVPIDLSTTLSFDNGTAWVGFTAATGGYSQAHSILSWSYVANPNPTGAHRPAAPSIREPSFDGDIVSPSDVHMETAPMVDLDGHTHVSTDWEIWAVSPPERVWSALGAVGIETLHIHLGDGVYEGSYDGRRDLRYDTNYLLKVRHRDSGGSEPRQWSYYATRPFRTGPAGLVFPMLLDDVAVAPAPTWTAGAGVPVVLPGGVPRARLVADSGSGQLLLEIAGTNGSSNTVTNPGGLPDHVPTRLRLEGGAAGLNLPATALRFMHDCKEAAIYLPAVAVGPGAAAYFWVAQDGATYAGQAGETQPQFAVLAESSPVPWVAANNFVVERFAGGFQLPVNIAFIPNPGPGPDNPLMYVTELYGTIKMVTRAGVVSDYATGLLNFDPGGNFPGSGETGLSGIVVDPATGDVFAAMVYEIWSNGPHFPKVVRLRSTDGGRTSSQSTIVLNMVGEHTGYSHFISNLTIGPDGKLYVHMGDGVSPHTAQDLNWFRGKVLRMNLDGTAPSDNPFYSSVDGITSRDYVFALGLRNPFGGVWRDSDGVHYSVENGPSVDRFNRIERGRNYLWDGTDASMYNFAISTWNPPHAPVNIAVVQPSVFGGSGFPPESMGHLFVTESGPTYATGPQTRGKRIVEFVVDNAGALVSGPATLVEYAGSGKATAVGLAAGPGGLYFTDLYKDQQYASPTDRGANVFRVRYAPIADCNGNSTPDSCDIAAGSSADLNADGIPDECECPADFNGDGFVDGIDYDLYVAAFEAGDPGADANRDGFVDGIDYDQFMNGFEAGC